VRGPRGHDGSAFDCRFRSFGPGRLGHWRCPGRRRWHAGPDVVGRRLPRNGRGRAEWDYRALVVFAHVGPAARLKDRPSLFAHRGDDAFEVIGELAQIMDFPRAATALHDAVQTCPRRMTRPLAPGRVCRSLRPPSEPGET